MGWQASAGALVYTPGVDRERYRFADVTLDVGAAAVERDGVRLDLPQLSFELLVALARRAPDVVAAEELIATVWAGTAVADETLTQRVALLRRALGDDAREPRYLRAVRGRGYQLVPSVERLAEEARREGASNRAVPRGRWALAALLGAAALSIVVFIAVRAPRVPAVQRAAEPAGLVTRPPEAAELLARAGTYLGRHRREDNELAIELYRKALLQAPEDADALAGLSLALGQRATKFGQPPVIRAFGGEEDAEDLARRALSRAPGLARAHHALGLALDAQGRVHEALAAYLEAARLDPAHTAALASAANLLTVSGRLAEALEADLRAAQGEDEILYLEVQVGNVLALLGFAPAAEVWFQRGVSLRPDSVFAAMVYARFLLSAGRPVEAASIAAEAQARGIRRPELATLRGVAALLAGERSAARAHFEQALEVRPDDPEGAVRLLLLDREVGGPEIAPRRQALGERLGAGRTAGDEWPDSSFAAALLAAGFGDETAALAALDEAIDLGFRDVGALEHDPGLAGLRGSAGLAARAERIRGLVADERQRVLAAPWLPPGFLSPSAGSAARMDSVSKRSV